MDAGYFPATKLSRHSLNLCKAAMSGVWTITLPYRFTDAAEWDCFTLRERIETIISQLTGLQTYVREQCVR